MTATGADRAPLLFRLAEFAFTVTIELARWAIYFTVGFACFAAIAGFYARYVVGNGAFASQMRILCGYLLYYVGVPLLVTVFASMFLLEAWRLLWRRVGFFEENGLRPVEVLVYAVVAVVLLSQANRSLRGHWERLPVRVASVLQLPLPHSARAVAPAASSDDRGTPAEQAEAGHAVLYLISQDAPRLRAQLLSQKRAAARLPQAALNTLPLSTVTGMGIQSFAPAASRAR